MTNKMMSFYEKARQTPRMICAWHLTGDRKNPLACVWVASNNNPACIASLPAETDEGGLRLCA